MAGILHPDSILFYHPPGFVQAETSSGISKCGFALLSPPILPACGYLIDLIDQTETWPGTYRVFPCTAGLESWAGRLPAESRAGGVSQTSSMLRAKSPIARV